MKYLHSGFGSLVACVISFSSVGCMITPEQGEDVGWIGRELSPAGFVLEGNMLIEVQAFNWKMGRWDTVATTRSHEGSNTWDGYDWHYWQSPKFRLAEEHKARTSGPIGDTGRGWAFAKLRALGDGGDIYTFRDWELGTVEEMYDKVYGTDVTIQGYTVYVD